MLDATVEIDPLTVPLPFSPWDVACLSSLPFFHHLYELYKAASRKVILISSYPLLLYSNKLDIFSLCVTAHEVP